jgi:hypothetical protein
MIETLTWHTFFGVLWSMYQQPKQICINFFFFFLRIRGRRREV